MKRTPEQIRRLGLQALRRALGPSDMIEFIQQFAQDTGDYAKDRHQWLDCLTLSDMRVLIAEHRAQQRKGNGKKPATRRAGRTTASRTAQSGVASASKAH